jgi:DNA-binding GntR family transcriptional regulator
MNAGPTSERVLKAIRQQLLTGKIPPGRRLDPNWFADCLCTSVTPVRDALHILVGQGLLETRPADGFHTRSVNEPGLRDLYVWNAQLVHLVIRCWSPDRAVAPASPDPGHYPSRTRALFNRIASRSGYDEHHRQIDAVNDRLEPARHAESTVIEQVSDELARLEGALNLDDARLLTQLLARYHRRRARAVPAIVRCLYQQR